MRLATVADAPTLAPISIASLKIAWPDRAAYIGTTDRAGFREQFSRRGVLVACTDPVDAYIMSERPDVDHWRVLELMPIQMTAQTGFDLIKFIFQAEHARLKFKQTTECMARLDKGSMVERATADSYKLMFNTQSRDVTDATGTVRATEIFMTALQVATRLGITVQW